MKKIFGLLLVSLTGCSAIEFVETPRNSLPRPDLTGVSDISEETREDVQSGLSPDDFFSDDAFVDADPAEPNPVGACSFVRQLGLEYKSKPSQYARFRLFSAIATYASEEGKQIKGVSRLSENPQMLYGTSSEFSGGKKPIDMPTYKEFMDAATAEYEKGNLSWVKYQALKKMYDWGWWDKFAKQRNAKVLEKIDEALAGAVTGTPQDLALSKLVAGFFEVSRHHSKVGDLSEDEVKSLGWWLVSLPLYSKEMPMARDWRRTIRILNRASQLDGDDLSFAEEACLYVLTQRMTSQILMQKGILGAPELKASGLLISDLPLDDVVIYPERNISGAWGEPLTAESIGRMVAAGEGLRPVEANTTTEFLNSFRAWANLLSARRVPGIWELPGSNQAKMPRLSPALLKLAVGIFALHAPVMSAEELVVSSTNRISFPNDDSALNLLRVGHVALATIWGVEGLLEDPSALDLALLSEEQRLGLAADSEASAKGKLKTLTNGLMLELFTRVREGKILPKSQEFTLMILYLKKTAYVLKAPNMLARIRLLEKLQTRESP
ncbi:hypothetical protein GW916_11675 [bacterium]|nr:hypothetical protein [bacterium]